MNWMNNWERAQAEREDATLAPTEVLKAKSELEHAESLIKDNIIFIYNEIDHGRLDTAKGSLAECRERYDTKNPVFLSDFEKIEELLAMKNQDLKAYENGDPEN